MPDEASEALEETQDNLQVEEPSDETETSQEGTDYESQYNELRSKFNERDEEIRSLRGRQALLDQIESDPDQQTRLLTDLAQAYYGQEEDEGEDESGEYEQDPGEIALTELRQFQAQAQARAEQDSLDDAFMDAVEELEQSEGVEFSAGSVRFLYHEAMLAGREPKETFKDLEATYEEGLSRKQTAKQKKAKAARAPSGGPGARAEDLTDPDKRLAALEREIEAARLSAES